MFESIMMFSSTIIVALIGGFFARDLRKRGKEQEKTDKQAAVRAEESRLSMRLMSAGIKLSMAIATAFKNGKPNGDMDAAILNAKNAEAEYYNFINGLAAEHITK